MWSALLGFVVPFVPDALKMVRGQLDHRQEMDMLRLRMEHGKSEHEWRMEDISLQMQAKDVISARRSAEAKKQSFGIGLLDAAEGRPVSTLVFNTSFVLFTFVDFIAGLVRPVITYSIVALWMAVKGFGLSAIYGSASGSTMDRLIQVFTSPNVWTQFDQELTMVVVGFWFGWRVRKHTGGVK